MTGGEFVPMRMGQYHSQVSPCGVYKGPQGWIFILVLEQNRIACAPVLSVVDTMKHPYFKAREMVREVPDPVRGRVTIPGFPLKFSATPELPKIQTPLLGQHGAEVLKDVLGYSDQSIRQLQRDGMLFSENR